MKILILLSLVLFAGACSQDSSSSPKKVTSQEQSDDGPIPSEGSVPDDAGAGDSTNDFWKSKKVSCSTRYVEMEYYLETSLRFQGDKMLSILDVHSWDNNSPGSSYKNTYTMKCNFKPDPGTGLSMVVCEEAANGALIAEIILQRNALDEIKASVYASRQSSEDSYCHVDNQ
jgi:hypothetical protein